MFLIFEQLKIQAESRPYEILSVHNPDNLFNEAPFLKKIGPGILVPAISLDVNELSHEVTPVWDPEIMSVYQSKKRSPISTAK